MSCLEARLGGAQFLADAELLFLEALDLARLIVGQQRTAASGLAGLQLAQCGFGLFAALSAAVLPWRSCASALRGAVR